MRVRMGIDMGMSMSMSMGREGMGSRRMTAHSKSAAHPKHEHRSSVETIHGGCHRSSVVLTPFCGGRSKSSAVSSSLIPP